MKRTVMQVLGLLAVAAGALAAQGGGAQPPRRPAPPQGGQGPRRGMPMDSVARALRQQEMRQAMAQGLKERFGLNDLQVAKLEAVHKKYGEKHQLLAEQARDIRMSLRDELLRPDSARTAQLTTLLDRQAQLGRQRFETQEAQRKELASFLTPLQRVKLGAAMMGGGRGGMGGGRGGMGGSRMGMGGGRGGMGGGQGMRRGPQGGGQGMRRGPGQGDGQWHGMHQGGMMGQMDHGMGQMQQGMMQRDCAMGPMGGDGMGQMQPGMGGGRMGGRMGAPQCGPGGPNGPPAAGQPQRRPAREVRPDSVKKPNEG